jgi:hypothetical protein
VRYPCVTDLLQAFVVEAVIGQQAERSEVVMNLRLQSRPAAGRSHARGEREEARLAEGFEGWQGFPLRVSARRGQSEAEPLKPVPLLEVRVLKDVKQCPSAVRSWKRDLQQVQSSDEGAEGAYLPQEAKVEVSQVQSGQDAGAPPQT